MDPLQINDAELSDPYHAFNRNKRSSICSVRSAASISSTYEPSSDFLSFNEDNVPNIQRRPSKKGISTFISKLYSMVEDGRHQNLISWNPSGTSFFVCNATQFAHEVLPEYFKHSNFSSFVRLLNMYGFHKINKSPRGQRGNNENEIWEFSHPKFQHSRSDLLKDIKRKAMDSELLRRETGDIHASFATLQLSQADLLQQFYILQDNFSNLLQSFEETKRIQLQQQQVINQLAERQGLTNNDLLQLQGELQLEQQHQNSLQQHQLQSLQLNSNAPSPLAVFVTSPNDQQHDLFNANNTMQFFNDNANNNNIFNHLQHPLQTTSDISMSVYDHSRSGTNNTAPNTPTTNTATPNTANTSAATSASPQPAMSPNVFDTAVNTPLPPSPVPSMMLESPMMTDNSTLNNNNQQLSEQHSLHPLKYEDINTLGLGL